MMNFNLAYRCSLLKSICSECRYSIVSAVPGRNNGCCVVENFPGNFS